MANKLISNSDRTHAENIAEIDRLYHAHHYLKISVVKGSGRSIDQNSMIYHLYNISADQLYAGDALHTKCECKLNLGIQILRNDDEMMDEFFGRLLDHLTYEEQLKAMKYVSVTSIMSRPQTAKYINQVLDFYAEQGVVWPEYLTDGARKFSEKVKREMAGDA